MKKIISTVVCIMALFSIGTAHLYAETLSDNYEFEKMLVYDRNSLDGRITSETMEIDLGLVVENNSALYPLKFTSLDFYCQVESLKTRQPVNDKIATIVGQAQNFNVSPRGTGVAVCSKIVLIEGLEPGQYIIHAHLRNSIQAAGGVQFNPEVQLETVITVYDAASGQQPDDVLEAVKDVNTNVMITQNIISDRMNKLETSLKNWGTQISSSCSKIYAVATKIYNVVIKIRR
jgi:hypothetical protein